MKKTKKNKKNKAESADKNTEETKPNNERKFHDNYYDLDDDFIDDGEVEADEEGFQSDLISELSSQPPEDEIDEE